MYSVTLTCVFLSEQFDCGTVTVSTSPPDLVQPGHVSHVYHVDHVARTWHEAEQMCLNSGGHLLSLGNVEEESRVMSSLSVSDMWTGGNMCPNSPGISKSFFFFKGKNSKYPISFISFRKYKDNSSEFLCSVSPKRLNRTYFDFSSKTQHVDRWK